MSHEVNFQRYDVKRFAEIMDATMTYYSMVKDSRYEEVRLKNLEEMMDKHLQVLRAYLDRLNQIEPEKIEAMSKKQINESMPFQKIAVIQERTTHIANYCMMIFSNARKLKELYQRRLFQLSHKDEEGEDLCDTPKIKRKRSVKTKAVRKPKIRQTC